MIFKKNQNYGKLSLDLAATIFKQILLLPPEYKFNYVTGRLGEAYLTQVLQVPELIILTSNAEKYNFLTFPNC